MSVNHNMELIRAGATDTAAVTEFYRSALLRTEGVDVYSKWIYGRHPTDEMISQYINENAMFLCRQDGAIVSAAAVTPYQGDDYHDTPWSLALADDEAAVIHILCVDPDFRGSGASKETMRLIIDHCRSIGKKSVRLDTLSCNIPAQRLYESLGFRKMSARRWATENVGDTDFFLYEFNL